ncbi:MAG: hypothetical protein NZ660_16260 [Oscillatoriaceae bacterium SKYG93]|nr:hypothetical protein [Oscillatoriaceae bacterium SKYG93]MDW8454995.1 hypothetical protein [Oscillatoriaceae cyanobacterium SKYGB_i_bin93]
MSSILWLSIIASCCLFFYNFNFPVKAQTTNSNSSIQQPRLRPNFSEEERRRRFYQKGFTNTFLLDSLNGVSDLLGGDNSGLEFSGGNKSLSPLTPEQRGIIQQPKFDPTDVIIPRSGIRR